MNHSRTCCELGKARRWRRGAMNHNRTGWELGKAWKRLHEEEEEEETSTGSTTDRISNLPEPIICHILSFLDIQSAVQTCVLSRAWRSAWKHVPVLDLRSESFREYPSFQRFVDRILSLRYPVSVQKMTYIAHGNRTEQDNSQFGRVVEYALHHDTQHLAFYVGDGIGYGIGCRFSNLFGSMSNCNLRTLELCWVTIDGRFWSFGFPRLNTLVLDWCPLSFEQEDLDPFSNFPCLQSLSLTSCHPKKVPRHMRERSFKISGLELVSLRLESTEFHKVEIVAPKLKSLYLRGGVEQCSVFSELTLPSLVHADVLVYPASIFNHERFVERHLFSLFQALGNANSLTLGSNTIKVLSGLEDELLEQLPSPFTRLKLLNVQSSSIPYRVADYFLKGSCAEPKVDAV
ncbi:unnamed protein product [Linum trigynum]|uniref:F-box domain-containing protein n=1 Tax=Linum trigynum TaxID=586398 RepID=A0AAV2ELA2_9ROSI